MDQFALNKNGECMLSNPFDFYNGVFNVSRCFIFTKPRNKDKVMERDNSVNPSSLGFTTPQRFDISDQPPPYTPPSQPIITQPVIHQTIIVQQALKGSPAFVNCPTCQERVLTKVKHESSNKTHLLAGFICGFTTWCCLCCLAAIPYLINSCKKVDHTCPTCGTLLGSYSKI